MLKFRLLIILAVLLGTGGALFSQNAGIRILRSINSPAKLPSDDFFRFVSDSHGYIVAVADASILAAGFIRHDDDLKKNGIEMLGSAVITLGITQGLKYAVGRERPFIRYPDIVVKTGATDPSFPSGHTSQAFAAATSVSLSWPKWYIIAPAYAWAGTVGYSRMHLGAHYPSDVLAGALIGSGCAWLTHIVNEKLVHYPVAKNR